MIRIVGKCFLIPIPMTTILWLGLNGNQDWPTIIIHSVIGEAEQDRRWRWWWRRWIDIAKHKKFIKHHGATATEINIAFCVINNNTVRGRQRRFPLQLNGWVIFHLAAKLVFWEITVAANDDRRLMVGGDGGHYGNLYGKQLKEFRRKETVLV